MTAEPLLAGDGQRERQRRDEVPRDQDGDEGRSDGEVGDHVAPGAPGDVREVRDRGQLVTYNDHVRGLQREVGSVTKVEHLDVHQPERLLERGFTPFGGHADTGSWIQRKRV
ncbi:hypothetical protein, partial [Promicromonospora umidemergens]|uniref:hypothetical protein n=1 Tax=Promicromonospora umidemergens TaxID=629679 RepID=UPI0031EA1C33